MNTNDISNLISGNSLFIALIIIFCMLTYYIIKFILDNEKKINKLKDKYFKKKDENKNSK